MSMNINENNTYKYIMVNINQLLAITLFYISVRIAMKNNFIYNKHNIIMYPISIRLEVTNETKYVLKRYEETMSCNKMHAHTYAQIGYYTSLIKEQISFGKEMILLLIL